MAPRRLLAPSSAEFAGGACPPRCVAAPMATIGPGRDRPTGPLTGTWRLGTVASNGHRPNLNAATRDDPMPQTQSHEWRRYGFGGPPEAWEPGAQRNLDRLATSYYVDVLESRRQLLGSEPPAS